MCGEVSEDWISGKSLSWGRTLDCSSWRRKSRRGQQPTFCRKHCQPCRLSFQRQISHPALMPLPSSVTQANEAFAREKVMCSPISKRACSRPILRSGEKWPCFSVHLYATLQPDLLVSPAPQTTECQPPLMLLGLAKETSLEETLKTIFLRDSALVSPRLSGDSLCQIL